MQRPLANNWILKMDRKTANREWRDVTRGAPEGVPTGRTVHEFAQRVEALALGGADKRLAEQRASMLRIARRAVVAMAHAAERDATCATAYQELNAAVGELLRA